MWFFGIGLILGILMGFYAGNPTFRHKVNAKIMQREKAPNVCIACKGTRLQTLKNGLRVQCPVCKGTGRVSIGKINGGD